MALLTESSTVLSLRVQPSLSRLALCYELGIANVGTNG